MKIPFARTTLMVVALTCCGLTGQGQGADFKQPPQGLPDHQGGPNKSLPPQPNSGIQGPAGGPAAATAAPAGAPGASKTPNDARRAALLKLLNSPDSTVVSVNGKSISAGEFRNSIRSYASKHARPMRRAAAKNTAPPASGGAALTARNNALLSELKQKLTSNGAQLPGTAVLPVKARAGANGTAFGRAAATTMTAAGATIGKPCPERPPGVVTVRGSLTPGGMIALEGLCFGSTQGQVLMYGDFPNGSVPLQVQMWADGGAAATVPADLTGVIDQVAHIQAVRADGQVSTLRNFDYVASRATTQLPASLVQLVNCTGFSPTECGAAAANHIGFASGDAGTSSKFVDGTDSWQVAVGNGWALQTMNISDLSGDTAVTGFDQGPPNFAAFSLNWSGNVVRSTTTYSFMDMVGSVNETFLASYLFTITAIGPTGVSPDPAVKPPYSGHAPAVGTQLRTADLPAPNSVVGTTLTVAPVTLPGGNQPVWNTIIGNGAAGAPGGRSGFGSPRPGSTVKPAQAPGQPTSAQPGAPVQN